MVVQTVYGLGMGGIFVYLVVATMRNRRDGEHRPAPVDEPGR
jgi:hypothetical protein